MNVELCLKKYSGDFFRFMFGYNTIDEKKSYSDGKEFLEKYSIDSIAFQNECKPIMKQVFKMDEKQKYDMETMPIDALFYPDYCFFTYFSSHIFSKEDFLLIKDICRKYNEKFIYIIEREGCEDYPEAAFKLKIPVDISWESLNEGGCITDVIFHFMQNDYYVFGDSGCWGKWCDYDNAIIDYETFAYKWETEPIIDYKKYFGISTEELLNIKGIPTSLKKSFIICEDTV